MIYLSNVELLYAFLFWFGHCLAWNVWNLLSVLSTVLIKRINYACLYVLSWFLSSSSNQLISLSCLRIMFPYAVCNSIQVDFRIKLEYKNGCLEIERKIFLFILPLLAPQIGRLFFTLILYWLTWCALSSWHKKLLETRHVNWCERENIFANICTTQDTWGETHVSGIHYMGLTPCVLCCTSVVHQSQSGVKLV